MKVLMISKAMVVGAYHQKLKELASLGVDLHVIVPPSWGSQRLEVKNGSGYELLPLEIMLNGRNHFHWYRNLEHTVRRIHPDIVHIDEEHYSIVTYQAMRLASKIGSRALFFTWQNIYKTYPFPFSAIERYNFSHARIAIAGNAEAREVLIKKGFTKKIAVIPQVGVDPDIFKKLTNSVRSRLGVPDDVFAIGFMGRIVPEKGILDLLDAVEELQGKFMVFIVGSGPQKEEVQKGAMQRGIAGKVKIIEQVPSFEVPAYLNCFDCLVLPSRTKPNWKEQFGRVLVEAMACEVPVIGSSSGEIPSVIGDAGLIFPEGDAAEFSEKINLLMTHDELRREFGKKGRCRVLSRYTQQKIATDTFAVYETLMRN